MILGGGVNGKPKSDSSCVSLLPQALCHVRVFLRDHKFAVIENYSNSDNPGAKVSLYEGQWGSGPRSPKSMAPVTYGAASISLSMLSPMHAVGGVVWHR